MSDMREITYAQAIREAIASEMRRDESVILLGEDIGVYGGSFHVLEGLFDEFGCERMLETPIAEEGFTGVAIGAALTGSRPIVEFMFSDFLAVAMDQIVNQAAKYRFMFGGVGSVPLVIRTPGGSGTGAAAQHSQSLEAWFTHIPGLKVVAPSNGYDAKGLLISAIRDPNPVLFFEQKTLYPSKSVVPEESYAIPLGEAHILSEGDELTIVSYGRMVGMVLECLSFFPRKIELIDLRTLSPLDMATVHASVRKTGGLLIVHEAVKNGGIGAEVSARVAEDQETFNSLKSPIRRVCGKDVPIPFAKKLEAAAVPNEEDIRKAIAEFLQ